MKTFRIFLFFLFFSSIAYADESIPCLAAPEHSDDWGGAWSLVTPEAEGPLLERYPFGLPVSGVVFTEAETLRWCAPNIFTKQLMNKGEIPYEKLGQVEYQEIKKQVLIEVLESHGDLKVPEGSRKKLVFKKGSLGTTEETLKEFAEALRIQQTHFHTRKHTTPGANRPSTRPIGRTKAPTEEEIEEQREILEDLGDKLVKVIKLEEFLPKKGFESNDYPLGKDPEVSYFKTIDGVLYELTNLGKIQRGSHGMAWLLKVHPQGFPEDVQHRYALKLFYSLTPYTCSPFTGLETLGNAEWCKENGQFWDNLVQALKEEIYVARFVAKEGITLKTYPHSGNDLENFMLMDLGNPVVDLTSDKAAISLINAVRKFHHLGLVHLDMKTPNTLASQDDPDKIFLIDFDATRSLGLHKDLEIQLMDWSEENVTWTASFRSPLGKRGYPLQEDMFSLGLMLLYGRNPKLEEARTPEIPWLKKQRELLKNSKDPFAPIIRKLLTKPRQSYENLDEVCAKIAVIFEEKGLTCED